MDDEMAKYPGLIQRDSGWQVRKRVPADLQHIEPRESIRVSLGTRDKREAIQRYPLKLAEIEAGFARLREELLSKSFVDVALATARIEDLGRAAIEGLVRQWWMDRAELRQPKWRDGQSVAEVLADLDDDERLSTIAADEGRDLATEMADQLLVNAGAASRPHRAGTIKSHLHYPLVDRSTTAYAQLRALVREGLKYEVLLARDHVTGDLATAPHPIFNPQGQPIVGAGKTIGNLTHDFRVERERLYGTESTARKYGLLFRVIKEQWGSELATSKITRELCVDLVSFIQHLPSNGTKKFRKLTLEQSIAEADKGGHKRLAPNTVATYVHGLCAILRWGKLHSYGVEVNTEGLKLKGGAEVERRGMTPNELKTIFCSLGEVRELEPHHFWIPALAAYTGARAEELCQLRTEDVIEIGGIDCLNLTRFDPSGRAVSMKRFKNRHSERIVPIHGELIAAGFKNYVAACDPAGRLFPDQKAGSKGRFSQNFSKWFGRFMDRIGYSDPALVFHSFRHGFRDACRDADIPEEIAHALGGWAAIDVTP